MCGRFVRHTHVRTLARLLDTFNVVELPPSYNVAPSVPILAARLDREGRREMAALRWGLVPYWARDPAIGYRTINARAESVATKPAFRDAFRHHRCLIPADGFYEWQKTSTGKQPYYVSREDAEPMFFAGLWDRWRHGDEPLETCTIITCDASEELKRLHERMPVQIPREEFDAWLSPKTPAVQLQELLRSRDYPVTSHPVSRAVNKPENDSPDCIRPVED